MSQHSCLLLCFLYYGSLHCCTRWHCGPGARGGCQTISRAAKVESNDFAYIDKSLKLLSSDLKSSAPKSIQFTAADVKTSALTKSLSGSPLHAERKRPVARRDVIGENDPELCTGTDGFVPGAAFGQLTWSNDLVCSDALVGPRHVLSVNSCLPNEDGGEGSFQTGYDSQAKYGSSGFLVSITVETNPARCQWKNDFLVIVLSERLGNEVGWFGIRMPEKEKLDQSIFMHQGYPIDLGDVQRPYRHTGTIIHSNGSLECDSGAALRLDTDATGGQAGRPLWEQDEDSNDAIWRVLAGGRTAAEKTAAT